LQVSLAGSGDELLLANTKDAATCRTAGVEQQQQAGRQAGGQGVEAQGDRADEERARARPGL